MTDRTQFEAMLEALINEDQETAKEIFHNIVVAKSREIYEELLAEDFDMEENLVVEPTDAPADGPTEEGFGADEEGAEDEEGADDEEGSDDEEGEDHHADVGGEEELEDRVLDLEDALDELKAEFEQLLAGEEGEDHGDEFGGDEFGGDDMGDDDFGGDDTEMAFDEEGDELVMEYTQQVGGKQYNQFGKMGDDGVNTKSIVASKNDMGGTVANIARGGVAKGEGTKGGLAAPSTKEENFGNINVPGGKAGKTAFKSKVSAGHGAEKGGSKETADNKKSLVGGK